MTPLDQRGFACRCEWGIAGVDALAPADVIIVVDVLSFSTCVDVAAGRGAAIPPYPWKDESAEAFAARHGAVLAQARGSGMYSHSPASFVDAPRGLRCILSSPNGAAVALRAAATGSVVLTACLRNASAVAAFARTVGGTFNVCPAGERWPDGSLRFAVEDWLGCGAVLRHLPGTRSPEADAAVAAFEAQGSRLADVLAECGSGRELIERGFQLDVEIAAEYDISAAVPRFDGVAFVAAS